MRVNDKLPPAVDNVHRTVKVPEGARLFFCTDVHGNLGALKQALIMADYDQEKDYLISVGDLCDRGPESPGTLVYFFRKDLNRYAVLGNHEHMFIADAYSHGHNGGEWVWDLQEEDLFYLREKIRREFNYVITVEAFGRTLGCVHAEIPGYMKDYKSFVRGMKESEHLRDHAIWNRDMIFHDVPIEGVDFSIHGHTSMPEVLFAHNRVYMDTGPWMFEKGSLTLLEFTSDREFEQYIVEL